jgi:hypothetical protein
MEVQNFLLVSKVAKIFDTQSLHLDARVFQDFTDFSSISLKELSQQVL